jgi:hypothetical protein
MVDPYAPPMDGTPSTTRPPTTPGPLTSTYEAPPYHEPPRARPDRPWREAREHERDRERELRTEPARPGLFWVVAAVGIGLLALARLVLYFAIADDLDGDVSAPAFLGVLGLIALSVGLALAGLLQRGLATPWRIALMLGAGFFAIAGWGPLGPVGFPL